MLQGFNQKLQEFDQKPSKKNTDYVVVSGWWRNWYYFRWVNRAV